MSGKLSDTEHNTVVFFPDKFIITLEIDLYNQQYYKEGKMKELSELNLPDDVLYSEDHEWAKKEGDTVKIGISDYAQDQLGDIVFVELPEVGAKLSSGSAFGVVESVKSVSDMLMPVGGEVTGVNDNLESSPELVNTDPYDEGWMIIVKPDDPSEYDSLMTIDEYKDMLREG